jgi:uroporphyrinogen decarboxylase
MSTAAERLRAVLEFRNTDRIPWTFDVGSYSGFSPALLETFTRETGIADYTEHFHCDFRRVKTIFHPLAVDREKDLAEMPAEGRMNEWGIGEVPWPGNPSFSRVIHPLRSAERVEDAAAFPVPEVDGKAVREAVDLVHADGRLAVAHSGSIYELAHWYRSMDEFLVDLAIRPEMAACILDKCEGLALQTALRLAEAGVDILAFYDDAGAQKQLQISPLMWRTHVKPRWARVLRAVKERYPAAIFFLHSCGRIEEIVEDIVDTGFDLLHPLQPECNDIATVSARVAGRMSVWGTISNQVTLPFGSTEDVRREIAERIRVFGRAGGLILSPSNIMGPEVPLRNVLALAEHCAELGSRRATGARREGGRE